MRKEIPGRFPKGRKEKTNTEKYLKQVDDAYIADAYHSLSIEGYRINRDLIMRVRSGVWNPDQIEDDR